MLKKDDCNGLCRWMKKSTREDINMHACGLAAMEILHDMLRAAHATPGDHYSSMPRQNGHGSNHCSLLHRSLLWPTAKSRAATSNGPSPSARKDKLLRVKSLWVHKHSMG